MQFVLFCKSWDGICITDKHATNKLLHESGNKLVKNHLTNETQTYLILHVSYTVVNTKETIQIDHIKTLCKFAPCSCVKIL